MSECLECKQETNNPKFCSSSCAAKFNNKNRKDKCPGKQRTKVCKCIGCDVELVVNLRCATKKVKCEICRGKCKYCKNPAKFKLKNGTLCCSETYQQCSDIKSKNISGVKKAHDEGRIPGWNDLRENCECNSGWAAGLTAYSDHRIKSKYDPEILFSFGIHCKGPRKEILILERGHKCEMCNLEKWLENKITLELDHIDGNHANNLKDNLRLLCPNCHSITPTWRGRNSNTGKKRYTDEEMIRVFHEEKNIAKTLLKLGMAPKGANYQTMYKILYKYGLLQSPLV